MEATRLTTRHEEALQEFRGVIDVKQALIKHQIVKVVDTTYLKSLCNADTNTITKQLHKVLAYHFQRYGKVR